MIIKRVVVGNLETNCYVIGSNGQAIVVDPGDEFEKIEKVLKDNELSVKLVVNTHAHFDHIGANSEFNAPVLIHKDDAPFLRGLKPQQLLEEGNKINVGDVNLEVIHTPGHTPGGICLKKGEEFILTGDTLFAGGVGRTDLPYGSENLLFKSIREKLIILNSDMIVYPGHGSSSTIGKEKGNF